MNLNLKDGQVVLTCESPIKGIHQNVWVTEWIVIDDQWYKWHGTMSAHKVVTESQCLTKAEFLEYYQDDLAIYSG